MHGLYCQLRQLLQSGLSELPGWVLTYCEPDLRAQLQCPVCQLLVFESFVMHQLPLGLYFQQCHQYLHGHDFLRCLRLHILPHGLRPHRQQWHLHSVLGLQLRQVQCY